MRQITEVLRLNAQCLSYRQIAQSIGISASTVQSYLERAERAGLSWPLPVDLDEAAIEAQLFTRTEDRKSTRLNSSHANISYAVFCLKKNNYLEEQPNSHSIPPIQDFQNRRRALTLINYDGVSTISLSGMHTVAIHSLPIWVAMTRVL